MVIKGSARGGAGELAGHLLRVDTNEEVNVLDLSGVASRDLRAALVELDGMGAGSRSRRPLYHASFNTPVAEQLSSEQQIRARERLAAVLGLSGQPFVVVEHVKHGRQHTHVVWSRVDLQTSKAIPDSHNYRRHELVSRELEREFGHQPVLGAHIRDKNTDPRPERGPTWGEQRQAERSGLTPDAATAIVTELWRQTTTGQDFRHRLEAEGFIVAKGDRRDFVLIDQAGEIHGLTRRIEGVKAAQVRGRMEDVDRDQLPTVEDARRQLQLRQQAWENATAYGVVGTAERLRADELKREAEARASGGPKLSHTHQDLADAIWQLKKTMRSEIEATIPGYRPAAPPQVPEQKQPPAPTREKGDLYERAEHGRQEPADAQKAADALRRQLGRRRDRSFEHEL